MMLGNFKNWKRQSPKDICKNFFEIPWGTVIRYMCWSQAACISKMVEVPTSWPQQPRRKSYEELYYIFVVQLLLVSIRLVNVTIVTMSPFKSVTCRQKLSVIRLLL